jgi:uncharacterized membrane protein
MTIQESDTHTNAMQARRGRNWLVAAIFVAVNIALRALFAGRNELAMDEPFTIWWAQHSLPEIFGMLKGENNPALHFVLMHYWIKIFGISELSVRMPSVIFSSVTAGILFLTAARHFSFRPAIFATALFTLSTLHMVFAHEARAYPLMLMLASWNLYLTLGLVTGKVKPVYFFYLFICNVLLIYTHYFAWIPLGLQLGFFLAYKNGRTQWRWILVVYILLLVCYFPNYGILYNRFLVSSGGTWVHRPDITELYGNLNRFLNDRVVSLVILVLAVAGVIVMITRKQWAAFFKKLLHHKPTQLIAFWFLLPYLGMFAVSFVIPIFLDRYILFTSLGFYLLIAAVFEAYILRAWVRNLAGLAVIAAMVIFFDPAPSNHRSLEKVCNLVREHKASGDIVIISPEYSFMEFSYHYDLSLFVDYHNTVARLESEDKVFPLRTLTDLSVDLADTSIHVVYLDCGSAFAFGNDRVGEDLRRHYGSLNLIYIDEVYKIYQSP